MAKIRFFLFAISILSLLSSSFKVFATEQNGARTANNIDSIRRVNALNLINFNKDESLNGFVSKGDFVVMALKAVGKSTEAKKIKVTSYIKNLNLDEDYKKYIEYAIKTNILVGNIDGNYNIEDDITLAQACTIVVRTRNISEIKGIWPSNYIEYAEAYGYIPKLGLSANNKIPKWLVAKFADNLWLKNFKDKKYFDFSNTEVGNISKIIRIYENNLTNIKLKPNQVNTNLGVLNIFDDGYNYEIGSNYSVLIVNKEILKVFKNNNTVEKYLVNIDLKLENNKEIKEFPKDIKFDIDGSIISARHALNRLEQNMIVILSKNIKGVYEYGILIKPKYSKPVIVNQGNIFGESIGEIKFSNGIKIVKGGRFVDRGIIKNNDVIYLVTDGYGINSFILVVENLVEGLITKVLPNKFYPTQVEIENKLFDLSSMYITKKKRIEKNFIPKNSYVQAILDKEGKIIEIYDKTLNFGFVVNFEINADISSVIDSEIGNEVNSENDKRNNFQMVTEENLEGNSEMNFKIKSDLNSKGDSDIQNKEFSGRTVNKVKILHPNGKYSWYYTKSDPKFFKNKLVKFDIELDYTTKIYTQKFTQYKNQFIDKDKKLIGEYHISDDIRIFNLIESSFINDTIVEVIDWKDMPSGNIRGDVFCYILNYGEFGDVELLVLKDIFNKDLRAGFIYKKPRSTYYLGREVYTYSIMVDDKEYTYKSNLNNINEEEAYLLKTDSSEIQDMHRKLEKVSSSKRIQAIDGRRIKLDGKIYWYDKNMSTYIIDSKGNIENKLIYQIKPNKNYKEIMIFADSKMFSEKIKIMVLKE